MIDQDQARELLDEYKYARKNDPGGDYEWMKRMVERSMGLPIQTVRIGDRVDPNIRYVQARMEVDGSRMQAIMEDDNGWLCPDEKKTTRKNERALSLIYFIRNDFPWVTYIGVNRKLFGEVVGNDYAWAPGSERWIEIDMSDPRDFSDYKFFDTVRIEWCSGYDDSIIHISGGNGRSTVISLENYGRY